jgi:hypothetical protein
MVGRPRGRRVGPNLATGHSLNSFDFFFPSLVLARGLHFPARFIYHPLHAFISFKDFSFFCLCKEFVAMQCASNRRPSILVHYTHNITEKLEPGDDLVGPWHETIGYMIVPIYIILDRTT